jgi:hypothetical protein
MLLVWSTQGANEPPLPVLSSFPKYRCGPLFGAWNSDCDHSQMDGVTNRFLAVTNGIFAFAEFAL